ncbi:MAG: hypothetical protein WAU68_13630 [Vitreimonas sp.]
MLRMIAAAFMMLPLASCLATTAVSVAGAATSAAIHVTGAAVGATVHAGSAVVGAATPHHREKTPDHHD